jgi:hypothetical protein
VDSSLDWLASAEASAWAGVIVRQYTDHRRRAQFEGEHGQRMTHRRVRGEAVEVLNTDAGESWCTKGSTGFGTRLLVDLVLHFATPASRS